MFGRLNKKSIYTNLHKKIIDNKIPIFFISLLLCISLVVFHRWFSTSIFSTSDWWYGDALTLSKYSSGSIWRSTLAMGGSNLILYRLPLDVLYELLGTLGFGTNISDKILVFWPSVIIGNISVYLLSKKVSGSNIGAFVGSLVFNYCSYYIVNSTAFLIYSSSVWVVFSFYNFLKYFDSKKLIYLLVSALLLFVAGVYDFRIVYIGVFVFFLYIGYDLYFQKKILSISKIGKTVLLFIPVSLFILLNFHWLVPVFMQGSLTQNSILNREIFGSEFLNILYAITLQHPFWTGGIPAWFSVEPILIYFWVFPFFAFLGLWLNRRNKLVVFFGIVAMFGIFLTKQEGQPLPNVYPWLYKNFVGFNAFREASKFYFLIALGYAVLMSSCVKKISELKTNSISKYILLFTIICASLLNIKPVITGEIGGIFTPKIQPEAYKKLNNLLIRDDEYFRVLSVPAFTRWAYSLNDKPQISAVDLINFEWKHLISDEKKQDYQLYGEAVVDALTNVDAKKHLELSSFKYLIVPMQDELNGDDVFIFYGKPRSYYLEELDKIPFLKRLSSDKDSIGVYANASVRPHLYTTSIEESIKSEIPYKAVSFSYINPSRYEFVVENISGPVFLQFSEKYNPGWSLGFGKVDWLKALIQKNYFLQDHYHQKNIVGLNSFLINPKIICIRDEVCKKNTDGTYTIKGTLYFKPQIYANLGISITSISLAVVLIATIILAIKNKNEKQK